MIRRLVRRSRAGHRGAVIVEAALILPLIMVLMFGMLEMGLYWKDSQTLSNAARDGVRVGASQGGITTLPYGADYYLLHQVLQSGVGLEAGAIQEVVVYDAADADCSTISTGCSSTEVGQGPPSQCTAAGSLGYTPSGGGIGSCNVYYPSDFTRPESDWEPASNPAANFPRSQHWPGDIRIDTTTSLRVNDLANPSQNGPDLIGVWVKVVHPWETGFISLTSTVITFQAVSRIEPQQ